MNIVHPKHYSMHRRQSAPQTECTDPKQNAQVDQSVPSLNRMHRRQTDLGLNRIHRRQSTPVLNRLHREQSALGLNKMHCRQRMPSLNRMHRDSMGAAGVEKMVEPTL